MRRTKNNTQSSEVAKLKAATLVLLGRCNMSSRSCSPSSPEPKRQRGNSSHRDGNESPPQLPDTTHTSQPRSRSPDSSSRYSKSQRKSSDHSSHSKSSRKHYKRSRSRSKSPHRRHESSTSRRSRSRSKSPGGRQGHYSSTRKSRSRSRSESPSHNRRTYSTRPHSRSPPVHKRRDYAKSSHRSRSRSKSPSEYRRDSGSGKQARSRSRSPIYNKRFGNRDYKPRSYFRNRRGGSDKSFRGRRETAQYYRTCTTPIAKLPQESTAASPNKPAVHGVPTSAEDLGLTPEQKLERALQAAQALNPKLSAPPPVSLLSSTSASVGLNTLASSPLALQKKKLLWNKKSSDNKWEGVSFGEEGDDEAQAKFRRLMGMGKNPSTQASSKASAQAVSSDGSKMKEKHEKLLKDLEQQYETSRFMTHLARGSGLGYGTSAPSDSTQ